MNCFVFVNVKNYYSKLYLTLSFFLFSPPEFCFENYPTPLLYHVTAANCVPLSPPKFHHDHVSRSRSRSRSHHKPNLFLKIMQKNDKTRHVTNTIMNLYISIYTKTNLAYANARCCSCSCCYHRCTCMIDQLFD